MYKRDKLWISLIEVSPMASNTMVIPGAAGAYVNVVAYAKDANEFRRKILRSLATHNVKLDTIESMSVVEGEPLQQEFEPAIIEAIQELSPMDDARFGTVHCFPPG